MAYKRMFALIYAGVFHNRICHDGKIAMKTGYPTIIHGVKIKAGMLLSDIPHLSNDEDCTHFLSCCLGDHATTVDFNGVKALVPGGGLFIRQPFKKSGVFGETYTSLLVGSWGDLMLRNHASYIGKGGVNQGDRFWPTNDGDTRAAITGNLQPGDVIAYASKPNVNNYEHAALLVGPASIACHSRSRFGHDYTDVNWPYVTLLRLP